VRMQSELLPVPPLIEEKQMTLMVNSCIGTLESEAYEKPRWGETPARRVEGRRSSRTMK